MILIMTATVCLASPLTDYSLGNVLIDISFGAPSLKSNNWSTTTKLNANYDVTAGMGSGFAGQYIYNDFKTRTPLNDIGEIRAQQFNLLTNKVNIFGNISAFIGISKTELVGNISTTGIAAGLVGTVPITQNTRAYATVSTGNHVEGYEFGMGYTFAENTELQLDYRNTNYKGIAEDDITVKGPYGGIVYNF